jgi:colanic acid/amylovoran biosynthesis glycosyltransferase
MFAIAANGFVKPTETFIRAHARLLAPGETLLVAERRGRTAPFAAPMIVASRQWPTLVTGPSLLAALFDPRRIGLTRAGYLAHLLRRFKVDTVMAEYGPVGVGLLPAVQAAGCRLFVHFHGVDASSYARDPAVLADYQRLFAMAEGIIAPSRYLAQRIERLGCPAGKLSVVPCGVELPERTGSQKPGQIIAIGRFVAKKGPLHTIRAFARIASNHPQARLTMVGDGPLLADARRLVDELGLARRIDLPGSLGHGEVLERLHEAAIFVQHSLTPPNGDVEGLPVSILEAMAAGIPVVATRHSGIPEAVEHGRTGILVDEGDIQGMGSAIDSLLRDDGLTRSLGAAGREVVAQRFALAVTIPRLQAILGLPARQVEPVGQEPIA